jgi:hypothetical protein
VGPTVRVTCRRYGRALSGFNKSYGRADHLKVVLRDYFRRLFSLDRFLSNFGRLVLLVRNIFEYKI